jgi:hypothetical protein
MIRTIITPQNTDLYISIPQKYVGKRVEITFLDLDEIDAKTPTEPKKKLSELAGKLSHETAESLQKHVTQSRNEWQNRTQK